MHQESAHKWLFILLNVGPEAMSVRYECEFTVNEDDLDIQRKGTPTELLPRTFDPFGTLAGSRYVVSVEILSNANTRGHVFILD